MNPTKRKQIIDQDPPKEKSMLDIDKVFPELPPDSQEFIKGYMAGVLSKPINRQPPAA